MSDVPSSDRLGSSLPEGVTFDELHRQAKALQRSVRIGSTRALDQVRRFHPRPDVIEGAELADFRVADAQFVIARRYGFEDWAALKDHLS